MAHTNACDHEHDNRGLAGDTLTRLLAAAEARCERAGQRLTAPRRRVLELLLQVGQPVKAYDLIAAFGDDGAPAKPPTVYRALDFLSKQGFAHRIESLNAYIACGGDADGHGAAFLICDCCGVTREIAPTGTQEIERMANGEGFILTTLTVEAHGLCQDCRS
ncbi:MAG: Fur family transcriptional regulator [Caulobacter sp.]|nr:Fur family transcriptional regulator [Caulobacter sp.]MDP1964511.1 Fur family transcriptional regulator [Reyranella sp.]